MNYPVKWSNKAVADLSDHISFLMNVSEGAAFETSGKIIASGESLSQFPERCAIFEMPRNFPITIRKCIVDSRYILLYGINDGNVMIYRVLDSRRKFDGLLD